MPACVAAAPHVAHRPRAASSPAALEQARSRLRKARLRVHHDRAAQLLAADRAKRDSASATDLSVAARDAAFQLRDVDQRAAIILAQLDDLAGRRAATWLALARDQAGLAALLPLIERLSLYPAETLLAAPDRPDRSLTGLMVVRALGVEMQLDAETILARRREIDVLTRTLQGEREQLVALRLEQQARGAIVASRAAAATSLQRASAGAEDEAAQQEAVSAARAADLQGVVSRLQAAETARGTMPKRESEMKQKGAALPRSGPPADGNAPVAGRLVVAWGAATPAGPAQGVTYAPPPLASVSAPCTGRIDFADRFRSYGEMVILDCSHDYRVVLAGLGRLEVAAGQRVARGAPVGRMPDFEPDFELTKSKQAGVARPTLYMQLRRGSDAIDPGILSGSSAARFLDGPT